LAAEPHAEAPVRAAVNREEEIDFGLSVLDESITRVVETAGN
jgi:hypothetical protein